MDAERILCARCDRDKHLGHLDPDNLRWYCEDCWMEFSGKSRLCFRCRDFVVQGSVDARDKRWYCTKCWEFYTKAPPPRRGRSHSPGYRERSPVRQYPTQRVFLTPNPAVAAQPQHIQPTPAPQYQIPVTQFHPQQAFNAPFQPQMAPQAPLAPPYMPAPQQFMPPHAPPFMPPISMPDISYAPMNNMNGFMPPVGPFPLGKGMDMDLDMMARNMGLPMPPNMGPNPFAPHMGPFGMNGKIGMKGMMDPKGGKKGKGKGAKGGFYDQPAGSPSTSADASRRFQGVVKDYGQKGAFGFINCVETAALYGRDVFIHKTQLSEALGINIDDHPEMRGEDFEVPIEFAVTTNNEKGLPQARDCWLVEDEVLRAKLMADAGIDPTKRAGLGNPRNFSDPLMEPKTQVRPLAPFDVPTPPPPVHTPDSSDSDNASKSSKADSDKDDSDKNSDDSNDSDKDSDKEDSDKEDSDKADHDHDDVKSDAVG